MCAARSPLTAFNPSRSHAEIAGEPRTPLSGAGSSPAWVQSCSGLGRSS